jgi:hypothetical protein
VLDRDERYAASQKLLRQFRLEPLELLWPCWVVVNNQDHVLSLRAVRGLAATSQEPHGSDDRAFRNVASAERPRASLDSMIRFQRGASRRASPYDAEGKVRDPSALNHSRSLKVDRPDP